MGTQSGNRPLAGTMIAPFNTAGLNVRFTPNGGHWNSAARCPLCAKSRHRQHPCLLYPCAFAVWPAALRWETAAEGIS